MKVATLGPEGTFSHELALDLFGEDILLLPTIRAVCEVAERGTYQGLVPIENSEAGGVGATLNCLQDCAVYIVGEALKPIHHHLAATGDLATIRRIYAHPQTHEQCSAFLEGTGWEVIHTRSNAESAVLALEQPHAGALLSEQAAQRYGLFVICRDVQNNPRNITRFVLLSSLPGKPRDGMKCSILVDPQTDRAGLLYDLLGVFAKRGINLTRIESRPSRREMGSYIFFIDFLTVPKGKEAVDELRRITRCKELGCYGRIE
jgi:prephenate dehydratase